MRTRRFSILAAAGADGAFKKKGYHALQKAVLKHMPPDQSPSYFMIGKKDAKFEKVRPFTVEA